MEKFRRILGFAAVLFLAASVAQAESLVQMAADVRPTARQLAWQQLEFTCFIHFGVNTFRWVEWGDGKEDEAIFNPTELDTDQWCETAKAAGMKLMLFTVKHHDGFCLWQTRYTTHSVASSQWKDGKGDVLRELAQSCKKYGLKLGVYLSPADLYQIEHPEGLYGNLSEYSQRSIPRPVRGRPFKDKRTFRYRADDYNEYFMNQLFELLTEYGPVHEVWFDGAHPKRKGGQQYVRQDWYDLIRKLAPEAAIAIKGPDVRWCGNEAGWTRPAEWSVIPIENAPDNWHWPDMTQADLGSMEKIRQVMANGGFLHWYPAETNTSIRHGWFWRDENQQVKSTEDILDIWYRSVGGNTVFLLNVPPNRKGLFSRRDSNVLREVGAILRRTFAGNLAKGAMVRSSGGAGEQLVLDGNAFTCWQGTEGVEKAELIVNLSKPRKFNRVVLQEQIRDCGQRIANFAVDIMANGKWEKIAENTVVGYKRICRTETVTADSIRVRILQSRTEPTISELGLYYEAVRPAAPVILRDRRGYVRLSCQTAADEIRYTLDGSDPQENSSLYEQPVALPGGGEVRARAFSDGIASETAVEIFDICKVKWRVVSASSKQTGIEPKENAIDADPQTIWHTRYAPDSPEHPHQIVIDLGRELSLKGFSYTPRTGPILNGTVREYAFYVSIDGEAWKKAAQGRFANIKNNPVRQFVKFGRIFEGRFVRFVALSEIDGRPWASAAEIGILTR